MAESHRDDDLQIGEDVPFQYREWTFERVGWVVMAVLAVAAVLGLFGTGPLSTAMAGGAGDALRVEYERFDRLASPTTLRVQVGAGAADQGQVRVWIDQAYLDRVQIERIEPEPAETEAGPGRTVYTFAVEDPERPIAVTFHLTHQSIGRPNARIGLVDGPTLRFNQLVYP